MWCYRRMMNIKWMDRITNEDRIRDMGCETFREVKELLASGGDRDMGPPRVDGEQQTSSCSRVRLDRSYMYYENVCLFALSKRQLQ